MFNPGEFNNRILINKIVEGTDDECYESEPKKEKIINCWAKINNLYGKELYEAINVKLGNTLNITTRYCRALDNLNSKELEIVWNNRKFNVNFIDYNGFNKKFVTFKCLEVI